ncbi:hypothetical protein [Absidia glauca]|uniref:Uncharacterized protein n=1 Tax=Absidia glauca TaxID=4829 RepID=A0A168T1Q2_ABSGL|nr:hypothetical protein [Absidia glauca]
MTSVGNQIEQLFAKKEHLAEEVIVNKQTLIDYDRKRNSNRESLNQLKKNLKDEKKVWLNFGDMFIRLPTDEAQQVIERDQKTLTEKIDETRKVVKDNMMELERLEGKKRMQGFDLEATLNDLPVHQPTPPLLSQPTTRFQTPHVATKNSSFPHSLPLFYHHSLLFIDINNVHRTTFDDDERPLVTNERTIKCDGNGYRLSGTIRATTAIALNDLWDQDHHPIFTANGMMGLPVAALRRLIITTINNFAQQHNITIETAANAAEERRSQLNQSLHYLAEHNDQIFG